MSCQPGTPWVLWPSDPAFSTLLLPQDLKKLQRTDPGTEAKVTQVTVHSHRTQSDSRISPLGIFGEVYFMLNHNILKKERKGKEGKDQVTLFTLLISNSSGFSSNAIVCPNLLKMVPSSLSVRRERMSN